MSTILPEDSVSTHFARIVDKFAAKVAISTPDDSWTYAQLDKYSSLVALDILELVGDEPEVVALLFEHGAPLIAAILGTLKANKIYLVLDLNYPSEQIDAILKSSSARFLLTDQGNLQLAEQFVSTNLKVLSMRDFARDHGDVKLPEISGDAPAWLMFTSGSTGIPKGIWQNHQGIVHEAETYAELAGITPEDRVSLLTHCGLSASGGTLFGALLRGATICPFAVRTQGIERLAEWIERERITVFHSVPTVFRHLARVAGGKKTFANVRLLRLGGEPVLPGDVAAFRELCPESCRFVQSLSSTETGLICTLTLEKNSTLSPGRVPAGRAVPGVEVFLLDESGQPLKNGGEGRIAVRSARLRQGYWRQPELVAEKFLPDPQHPGKRTFISNDLGRFRPDGMLEHLGRADQLVKIRGQRADLMEVEAAILATELVQEVVVAAYDDVSGEKRLTAYFVPRPGAGVSARNFRQKLIRNLPEHMIPADYVPLPRLPVTAAGKIDRRSLPLPPRVENKAKLARSEEPKDVVERPLSRIWQSVLNISPIGRTDDFFELGGTSLQSVEVLLHIEKRFGISLPPSTLAEHSTIEKLAVLVRDHVVLPSPKPLVTLRAEGSGRPLFLIHSGQGDVASYGLLTRRLPGRPVYGLQSVGLQGESWPLMSIEAMAESYLKEVLEKDPTGPYFIGATCMGGMVALEMSRRLVKMGKEVALLAFIDVHCPRPYAEETNPAERYYGPWRDRVRDGFRVLRWSIMRSAGLGHSARGLLAYRHFVARMNSRAFRSYRPGIFPGEILLFNSADTQFGRADLRLKMRDHAQSSRVISVPGVRAGMFIPPMVDELARQLQTAITAAETKTAEVTTAIS